MDGAPDGVRLGARLYLSYGVGAIGTVMFSTVPGLLLLYYMTDTLGIAPGLAGAAMFAGKGWDLVTDPMMGAISDRTRSRWGRRRPWMLLGALTLPVCLFLLFRVPAFETVFARWLWVLVAFVVGATAFSIYQVPYVAMPAEMTRDSHEQTVIMSWRMSCMIAGILVAGGLAPLLVQAGGGGRPGYALMASVVSAISFVTLLAAFLGTSRAPMTTGADTEVRLRTLLAAAVANRPFRLLVTANVVQLTGVGALLAVVPYVAVHALRGSQSTVTVIFLCLVGPAIAVMPLWVAVGKRLGKRKAYMLSVAAYGLSCIPLGLVPPQRPELLYVLVALAGVAYAGTQLFPFSMLPDTMHAGHAASGIQQEGVLAGLFTASEKIGMAIGPLVTGVILSASGFVEATAGAVVAQPPSALTGIRIAGSIVPALLVLASLLPLRLYDLDP
ncbi:MAG: MFS transporter [Candidatus Binatia bacterium]